MSPNRPWQLRKDEIVQAYVSGERIDSIKKRFGITGNSIFALVKQAGVPLRGFPSELKYDHEAIIADYLAGMPMGDIAAKHNLPHPEQIRFICQKHGVKSNRHGGALPLSMKPWKWDFFNGRTEEAAYWAGFLMADGSLAKEGLSSWCLSLTLHERDVEHLYAFCDVLGLDRGFVKPQPTKYKEKSYMMYRVSVYHPECAEILLPWGIVPRKTYNFSDPNVALELLPAYLRGWADGDGSVLAKTGNTNFRMTGNYQALQWYESALHLIGFTGNITMKHPEGKVWGRLEVYGKHNVQEIARLLKVHEFGLRRKWDKVLNGGNAT